MCNTINLLRCVQPRVMILGGKWFQGLLHLQSKTISPPSEEFSFALFSGRTPLGFVDILFYLHRTFGLACSQGEILVTIVDNVCICHLTWSSSIWQLATCFEKICFTPFTLSLECVRSNICMVIWNSWAIVFRDKRLLSLFEVAELQPVAKVFETLYRILA